MPNTTIFRSKEVRVIRNDKSIRSYRDAQGFRKNNRKLRVKLIDAFIYHYGLVKSPAVMKEKLNNFHRLWHDEIGSAHVCTSVTNAHLVFRLLLDTNITILYFFLFFYYF